MDGGRKVALLAEVSLVSAVFALGTNPVAVKYAVGEVPALPVVTPRRRCLGGGVHPAVDLLHEGIAVLALLLVGAELLELLDGEAVELLNDLGDRQPGVVVGPEGLQHGLPRRVLVP